jgi:hypothetical protein
MCSGLIACIITTGCATAATHGLTRHDKTVVQFGEFCIEDVFCDENVSVEELTDAQAKVRPLKNVLKGAGVPTNRNRRQQVEGTYPRIVLKGSWRLNDDKEVLKRGYIVIEAFRWRRYLSYCKANHLEPTPIGALEYHNTQTRKRKSQFTPYPILKELSDNERRITDRFPPDGTPITIPLNAKRISNPLKPLSIPLMFLSVPLDIATFPIQVILFTEWSLNGGKLWG